MGENPGSWDGLKGYHEQSKDLYHSLIFVMPLFVFYQLGILLTDGVQNGVDFVTQWLWIAAEGALLPYVGINLGFFTLFLVAVFALRKNGHFNPKIWPWVVGESTVYALLLGGGVIQLMSAFGLGGLLAAGAGEPFGVFTAITLSIGAGLYEEAVFRLLLMGGIFQACFRWTKFQEFGSAATALLVSSLLFSAVHYVGPMADVFELHSFFFRFFAGIILATIFYFRGFAVAVYTHAIYDIIVMVFHS
jgi:membrane protease YdiL (CAAX protease family)